MRHRAPDVVSQVSNRGEESIPFKPTSYTQPSMQLDTFAARAHCWLTFKLSTMTPSFFSTKLLSIQSVPNLSFCIGLCQPRCKALCLPLLNFRRSPTAHFCSPTRSIWVAALPVSVSSTPLNHPQTCWEVSLFHHPGHYLSLFKNPSCKLYRRKQVLTSIQRDARDFKFCFTKMQELHC